MPPENTDPFAEMYSGIMLTSEVCGCWSYMLAFPDISEYILVTNKVTKKVNLSP
jgi:hypothetical protein